MAIDQLTPVGADFLKNWPGQNAVNCDRIDDYAGPCLTSHAIQNYVPALTADTTNPSLGTGGSLVGKYYKIFDQIFTWGEFRFGSGASIGSGVYRISLPFRARTLISVNNPFDSPIPVGTGQVFDLSSAVDRQPVTVNLGSPDFLVFTVKMGVAAGTRGVTHNSPIIWSGGVAPGGDGIMWYARYQREP